MALQDAQHVSHEMQGPRDQDLGTEDRQTATTSAVGASASWCTMLPTCAACPPICLSLGVFALGDMEQDVIPLLWAGCTRGTQDAKVLHY